jgi:hypothetical protein
MTLSIMALNPYAEYCYDECRLWSVAIKSSMLSVIMLSAIMLCHMLSVIC